jgi:hypothetical protein
MRLPVRAVVQGSGSRRSKPSQGKIQDSQIQRRRSAACERSHEVDSYISNGISCSCMPVLKRARRD